MLSKRVASRVVDCGIDTDEISPGDPPFAERHLLVMKPGSINSQLPLSPPALVATSSIWRSL